MTEVDERRYSASEAARLIGCAVSTVLKYASRLWGLRRRPGAPLRLTAVQVEQLRQAIEQRRRPVVPPPG